MAVDFYHLVHNLPTYLVALVVLLSWIFSFYFLGGAGGGTGLTFVGGGRFLPIRVESSLGGII